MISGLLALWAIIALFFFYAALQCTRRSEERSHFRRNPIGYLLTHIGLACCWPLYFLQWLKEGWDDEKAEHKRRSQ